MTRSPFIADTVYILFHARSPMSQLHCTNKYHYVLLFAHALNLSSCIVAKCDGRMCRFIYTTVH